MRDAWATGRASFHRSKACAPWGFLAIGVAAAVAGGAACGAKNDRVVTVYVPVACPVASTLKATYTATGDFSPPAEQSISLASEGAPLASLPSATRSMLVEAERFVGVSLVDSAGPVDVLVLPNEEACHFTASVNPPVSAADPGATFGIIDAHHALLVGGKSADAAPSVIDLGTGGIASASPSLVLPRNRASVTPFGTGALVAGGESSPDAPPAGPFDTAEVYQPASGGGVGGFMLAPIILVGGSRARHGAVALATGETLLVGGTDGARALSSLEYVSPGAPKSVVLSLTLSTGRIAPTVFRLPSGKIFVGGGFDETGAPVRSVEWLDGDHLIDGTSSVISPVPLCTTAATQGFAPLEGGAVLAVFGAKPTATCSNVLVVRPDYAVDQAPPLSLPPSSPMLLFQGASSSPVLLTADQALRWSPWDGQFEPLNLSFAAPGKAPSSAFLSPDPGLGIWLGTEGHVWGMRFDFRNAYSTDVPTLLLLSNDTTETAPDRLLPSPDIEFLNDEGLTLRDGASVFITDATYADATLDFTALAGDFRLILRDDDTGLEYELGQEGSCFTDKLVMGTEVRVVRKGATLHAGIAGGASFTPTSCVIPAWLETARIAIGFRGPANGPSTIRSVSILRTGSAD